MSWFPMTGAIARDTMLDMNVYWSPQFVLVCCQVIAMDTLAGKMR